MSGASERFRGGRVVVVGAINVDFVVAADRLPGPGETVVGSGVQRHGGGKGANASVAAARTGATVRFLGAVGTDAAGGEAQRELEAEGVDCSGLARLADHPTGVALIVVDPAGENQIAVGAGANLALDPEWVSSRIESAAADLDCVLVSTEIPEPTVIAAVAAAARAGITCVLNPAPPTAAVPAALTDRPILTPNRGELRALLQLLADQEDEPADQIDADDTEALALALAQASGSAVIVTLGSDGVLVVSEGRTLRLPSLPVHVRDATGAGDTFNGVLAAQLAAGHSLVDATRTATAAASLSVAAAGARGGMPRREAIRTARGRDCP